MKSYDELKAKVEAMQQMVEAKKSGRASVFKEVKHFCKECNIPARMLKDSLAEDRRPKRN